MSPTPHFSWTQSSCRFGVLVLVSYDPKIKWNQRVVEVNARAVWVIMLQIVELLVVVLSISPGTGLLERSCSKLLKSNHLNTKSIESLWLLVIFQLNDDEELFDGVWRVMSQTNEWFQKALALYATNYSLLTLWLWLLVLFCWSFCCFMNTKKLLILIYRDLKLT